MTFYFGWKYKSIVITCKYHNNEYENRNNYEGPGLKKKECGQLDYGLKASAIS